MLKNIAEVSKEEQKLFIDSFDQVLSDIDGVIWQFFNPIPGAAECTQTLQKLGKKVCYATNNAFQYKDIILDDLNTRNFITDVGNIITPQDTVLHYLRSLNLEADKELYVIGCQPIKDTLKKHGYKLVADPPSVVNESLGGILDQYDVNPNVAAVVMDMDMNINMLKLQKAFWYLKNPKCQFIVTLRDKSGPMGHRGPLLGPFYFVETVKDLSGREYVEVGKPSAIFADTIRQKFGIKDPRRALFMGDSIQSDMGLAVKGGFQKLLVLSGTTTIENVINWQWPEEYKPEYYVQDLGVLNDIIKAIYTL